MKAINVLQAMDQAANKYVQDLNRMAAALEMPELKTAIALAAKESFEAGFKAAINWREEQDTQSGAA